MSTFDHKKIEAKWSKRWAESKLSETDVSQTSDKFYCLDMFPYPSGEGLHVGHWRGYVLSDYFARYYRLQGKNVLHPIGFDAFGLPAENAAIKNNSQPKAYNAKTIPRFIDQLKQIGAVYDWSKTIRTDDPSYYRWTQWLFLQFYKHGYAEKRSSWVNWCPKDKTVLANEQVVAGKCDLCGTTVTKKELAQWYLKITQLADELLEGLDTVEWQDNVKTLQRNWIGRSTGTTVTYHTEVGNIDVFTTRVDTIFGVNALVLAPEHPLVAELTQPEHQNSVLTYIETTKQKSDLDRQKETKNRTGVFTGSFGLHPLTKKELPIWVADYVLPNYGTGAVMSVPAHDERDYDFSTAHNLPTIQVIATSETLPADVEGQLINSDSYTGLSTETAREKLTKDLERKGLGRATLNYRLRDWLVSRQRYWGAPIPIVYDPKGDANPIKEEHLPLLLPEDVQFKPGENPIARSKSYQQRAEDLYGKGWRFETDTLDTFVDSSWYYLRYLTPTDETQPFDPELVAKWLPVDLYIGGIEHAILHLLYARFIYRFLVKHDYIQTDRPEPFQKLFNIGMVELHGAKMSKSKGNIVSPDELVEHYGTDALRGYELFLGPMDNSTEWNPRGINGIHRFLIKVWQLSDRIDDAKSAVQQDLFDRYLTKINQMMVDFRLNTTISEAMIFVNHLDKSKLISRAVWANFLISLAPAFPFIAEELWEKVGHQDSIFHARWPKPGSTTGQPSMLKVLIDQKFVGELTNQSDQDEAAVISQVKQDPALAARLSGRTVVRTIYKPGELINIITKSP